ncbi:hypothetical protein GDO81_019939 [Engystomops pustulosus]|uniref:Parathyroid hormone n=1 Tax=Engystomops pustulosus TaxID=76066 RepID=A0AAV6YW31_ENGPU|nr:hypothetical protein GDO81_019939 [Engystomops pustulosus]
MFLSQKSLQLVTFLGILSFTYLLAFEITEKERSVSETQFMHDKGKFIQDMARQQWLKEMLEMVHNPGQREVPQLRSLHREVHGISTERQQRLSVMENNGNLQ